MKNWRVTLKVGWRNDLEEKLNTYIVDRLVEARNAKKYSQRKLSQLLGRSNAYISQIEGGRVDLSVIDLIGVSLLLEKPIKYFLPIREDDEGKLDGQEGELVRQFRKIEDELKEAAIKQVEQLAKLEKSSGKK